MLHRDSEPGLSLGGDRIFWMGKVGGWGRIKTVIPSNVLSEEGEVSSVPPSPVKTGRGLHILMSRLARTFATYRTKPTNSNSHLPL
ncbi:hypothetical protein J6590_083675 [Homalodisca vitripennis]|nr:hypothetical protein J6590_083675 [Homalodisca vitripennis]